MAEKRTQQLRIISAESLLSLAELLNGYDVEHTDILALLRPASPTVDPVVNLITRLIAQQTSEPVVSNGPNPPSQGKEEPETMPLSSDEVTYWLTPVKADKKQTAEEVVETLVGQAKVYAFAENTPGRKHLKPGDWISFYAASKGVVGHAKVVSAPQKKFHPSVHNSEKYEWIFEVDEAKLHLDEPFVIDAHIRSQLKAFEGKDPNKNWAWFVQATRRLNKHDFETVAGVSVNS